MKRLMRYNRIIGGMASTARSIFYKPKDTSRAATNVQAELDKINDDVSEINTHLNGKLDSKYGVKKIWEGDATFTNGHTKLLKSLYPYDVFIPLCGQVTTADSPILVSLDNSGNTNILLPISQGYSGNLHVIIYGIGYDN